MENKISNNFSSAVSENIGNLPIESEPTIEILPQKSWYDLDWKGVWKQRDLLKSFVMRDLRLRYRQTLLGVLWAIIQPLAPLLVYTLIFNRFFGDFNKGVPYAIYVFCALIPWLYFSNAVTNSGNSLSHYSYLIGKIYFPRVLLPMSAVMVGALDFTIGSAMLFVLLLIYGVSISWSFILIFFLWFLLALLALAIGMIFASLSVVFRDVRNLLPFVLQLGFFLTPILYPPEALPEKWQWILTLNPITGIIQNMRAAVIGSNFLYWELLFSLIWTLGLSFIAMIIFVRVQRYTADYL